MSSLIPINGWLSQLFASREVMPTLNQRLSFLTLYHLSRASKILTDFPLVFSRLAHMWWCWDRERGLYGGNKILRHTLYRAPYHSSQSLLSSRLIVHPILWLYFWHVNTEAISHNSWIECYYTMHQVSFMPEYQEVTHI